MDERPHVVILGAGFAGVGAMKKLQKAPVRVTLIDKNDYHAFLPLLYQVATSELGPSEVGFPARELLHDREGFLFHQAEITGIDLDARQVSVEGSAPISYDYLIVGLGAVVNFFGTQGAVEHAFPLYTLDDALRLKSHIFERLEAADKDAAQVEGGALRFCVVGGGATGVEISGAIAELLQTELREDYPNLPVEKAEVHLYEMGPHLLSPFQPKLQAYAKKALEEREVQVHLGEGVVAIEPDRIHLKSGDVVNAHTLVWGAGLTTGPLAKSFGVELVHGRIPVGPGLNLEAHPEVYVVGDIALITDAKTGEQLPQLGSVALQAGTHAAENITRIVDGKQPEPFEYEDKGTMATIGRGAAIMQLRSGRTMTGHAAWLAWLGVHLMLLSGGEQKAHTFVDWGWNVVTKGRGKRLDAA
jgi:NADH:ubiquinone reductase (H+-translocating)